jgi:hypothetical protein
MLKKILNNLYPYIFGLFSVLNLYLHNFYQVEFFRVVRCLLVVLFLTGLIELIIWAFVRNMRMVRILTSFVALFFFFYHSFYLYLGAHPVFGVNLGRIRYLMAIFLLLFSFLLLYLRKRKKAAKGIENFVGLFSSALVLFLIINFASLEFQKVQFSGFSVKAQTEEDIQTVDVKPNIYNIVLDGYASSRALAKDFKYDNSGFETSLQNLGFILPEYAYSNYDETIGSLGSELNMDYVHNIVDTNEVDKDRLHLIDKLVNSKVRSYLEKQGYKVFAFENEFRWSLWSNVDFYESPRHRSLFMKSLNSFEVMYLESTIVQIAENFNLNVFNQYSENLATVNLDKFEEQSFLLNKLDNLPSYIEPKFVFAHITTTHVPFVFSEDGSLLPKKNQGTVTGTDFTDPAIHKGYIASIQYTNNRLLSIVTKIIKNDPDAIIIIQGDHGYPGEDRNQIFLAVYDGRKSIEGINCLTPINLYGLILNSWFGTDYPSHENALFIGTNLKMNQYEPFGTCESVSTK